MLVSRFEFDSIASLRRESSASNQNTSLIEALPSTYPMRALKVDLLWLTLIGDCEGKEAKFVSPAPIEYGT